VRRFECRMAADGARLDLLMYGPIGTDWYGDGSRIDAKAVATTLNANKSVKEIRLQIASAGGDPFHALAMYSVLKDHPAKKVGVIEGLCASSMTVVAAACDELEMSEAGLFMIHEAKWGTFGTVAEQQSTLDATAAMNSTAAEIYAARTKKPIQDIKALMAKETWMTAKEAKDQGFVDSTKPLQTMSAVACPGQFSNVPDHIKPILAKLQEDVSMTTPAPGSATPPPAPAAVATPAAPAVPAPAAPAPAAAAPAVPVAQPVAPTAEMAAAIKAATERASAITSACVMAGKPEMASKYIDDPAATVASVQGALLQLVCNDRKPSGDTGAGAGDPNPNAKFEKEFDDNAETYAQMGLSKEQYVKSRRIDERLEKLPIVPVKK